MHEGPPPALVCKRAAARQFLVRITAPIGAQGRPQDPFWKSKTGFLKTTSRLFSKRVAARHFLVRSRTPNRGPRPPAGLLWKAKTDFLKRISRLFSNRVVATTLEVQNGVSKKKDCSSQLFVCIRAPNRGPRPPQDPFGNPKWIF